MKFCNSNFSNFSITPSRKPFFFDFSRGNYLRSHVLTVERGQIDFVLDVLSTRNTNHSTQNIPFRTNYIFLLSFQETKQK